MKRVYGEINRIKNLLQHVLMTNFSAARCVLTLTKSNWKKI